MVVGERAEDVGPYILCDTGPREWQQLSVSEDVCLP